MSQDTNVQNLIINKLTKQQYEGITNPDPTQLYFVTDEGTTIAALDDVSISNLSNGQILQYDSTSGKWENTSAPASAVWGNITGTLSNQTDLQNALDGKQATLVSGTNIKTINSTSLLGSGNIKVLQNAATANNAITILGTAATFNETINIGYNSSVGERSTAIGSGATASGIRSLALGGEYAVGNQAIASANGAIQIGPGTNSTASTLAVGFGGIHNYQLLDGTTGKIPGDRLQLNNSTISLNTSDELQAIGVINRNDITKAVKTWTGTKEEYELLKVQYLFAWTNSGTTVYTLSGTPVVSSLAYSDNTLSESYVISAVGTGTITATVGGQSITFTRASSSDTNSTNRIDPDTLYNVNDDTEAFQNYPTRVVGQIIQSSIPLVDSGLHLLDGSLIQGNGIYADFVSYIASLYSANPNASYFCPNYVDLPWTQPILSANGTMGGSSFAVSASATQSNYDAYKAFDGINTYETATAWLSGTNSLPVTYTFYNPNPLIVTKLAIRNFLHRNNPDYSIGGGQVLGSNDNTNWDILTSFTNTNGTGGATWKIDLSGNSNAYKYYKINITSAISHTVGIGELTITAKQRVTTTSEQAWQSAVSAYGTCGKFVYDSVNNTVRLPKLTGIIEGTTDLSTLGDLTYPGLPNITGTFGITTRWGQADMAYRTSGAFSAFNQSTPSASTSGGDFGGYVTLDASLNSDIYGSSDIVQPQSIKVLYYIVVATSARTDILVDIDEVATDLAGKADTDLSNLTNAGKIKTAHCAMPSDKYDDLTLGASWATYEAPADGYFTMRVSWTQANSYVTFWGEGIVSYAQTGTNGFGEGFVFAPARKGDIMTIAYNNLGTIHMFRFVYAVGSESEAS